MTQIDVAVIGAGVSGLASARQIAERGRSVCVLERHPRAGLETSTRNSGVIHAGMYYPPGSLKTRLCVDGRRRLYSFCDEHGVPHRKCGKLIVGHTTEDRRELEALRARGEANGVEGLQIVDAEFIGAREPAVDAPMALWSPETGIVDADALVKALLRTGQERGVLFLPGTAVVSATRTATDMVLCTGREEIRASAVVNAAGLYADDVSRIFGGEAFTIYPCRGEYAQLTPAKRSLVNGLVYPLPPKHSLGVHVVKTMSDDVWLGPTASFQHDKNDYESHRLPLESFVEPARRLLRGITVDDLRPGPSGIRPKLHPPTESFADFLIRRDRQNPFLVHAAGIESPGLTSCLAVADEVCRSLFAES